MRGKHGLPRDGGHTMQYAYALAMAEDAKASLVPHCQRIEIAGSIRRQRPTCGDIELVCIPKMVTTGLFNDELIASPDFCAAVNQWPAVRGKPDGKHTKRILPCGEELDLFMVTAETWGLQFAIRTGSADYSRYVLATEWKKLGYTSIDAMLHRGAEVVQVREERDLFTLLGLPWVDPRAREYHKDKNKDN
jgi:DNA polymerase/3'-5' exonuclease PolX